MRRRSCAIGVLVGVHLARLGLDPGAIGLVVGARLAGCAAATLLVTLGGDRLGRRRTLFALALLTAAGGLVVAAASTPLVVGLAAFLGLYGAFRRVRPPEEAPRLTLA